MTGDGLPVQDDAIRKAYRDSHDGCELIRYFPREDQRRHYVQIRGVRHSVPASAYGQHIHHCFAMGRQRWDRVWNLLHISRVVHDWCHAYPVAGRVLALHHKLRVGEWDEENAVECLGFSPLGWVHGHKPDASDPAVVWVVPYWEMLVREKGVA